MKLITKLAWVLLLALSTKSMLGAADATSEAVLDTSGRKLQVGANYYVVPDDPAQYGGGLDLGMRGVDDCPLDVIPVQGYQGQPLSFTPFNTNKGVVHVSTDLNIEFSAKTICPQTNVWKLDNYDRSTGQWFITTGGARGNPGRRTVRNWFKIEKYEDAYKLSYCPDVCSNCKVQCQSIGFYLANDETKQLALSDTPLKVKFQRA